MSEISFCVDNNIFRNFSQTFANTRVNYLQCLVVASVYCKVVIHFSLVTVTGKNSITGTVILLNGTFVIRFSSEFFFSLSSSYLVDTCLNIFFIRNLSSGQVNPPPPPSTHKHPHTHAHTPTHTTYLWLKIS